jgi:hypothetical protein
VVELFAQPFRLRYAVVDVGWREHVPDFLAVTAGGVLVVDVRPGDRIGPQDEVAFAATAEVAVVAGWRYLVVTGWRRHVMTTLDTLSAARRPVSDSAGLQDELLAKAAAGPALFGELVAAARLPVLARAHALHLIWWRRLAIDLAGPGSRCRPGIRRR